MKKLIFSITLVFAGVLLYAQPADGTPGGAPTPIDGGISLLIAAGAAYGGKKAFDSYKKKEEEK